MKCRVCSLTFLKEEYATAFFKCLWLNIADYDEPIQLVKPLTGNALLATLNLIFFLLD